jgi:hypothetical protein
MFRGTFPAFFVKNAISGSRGVVFTLMDGEPILNDDYKWLNYYYYIECDI